MVYVQVVLEVIVQVGSILPARRLTEEKGRRERGRSLKTQQREVGRGLGLSHSFGSTYLDRKNLCQRV